MGSMSPPLMTHSSPSNLRHLTVGQAALGVVCALALGTALCFLVCCWRRFTRRKKIDDEEQPTNDQRGGHQLLSRLSPKRLSTNGFKDIFTTGGSLHLDDPVCSRSTGPAPGNVAPAEGVLANSRVEELHCCNRMVWDSSYEVLRTRDSVLKLVTCPRSEEFLPEQKAPSPDRCITSITSITSIGSMTSLDWDYATPTLNLTQKPWLYVVNIMMFCYGVWCCDLLIYVNVVMILSLWNINGELKRVLLMLLYS